GAAERECREVSRTARRAEELRGQQYRRARGLSRQGQTTAGEASEAATLGRGACESRRVSDPAANDRSIPLPRLARSERGPGDRGRTVSARLPPAGQPGDASLCDGQSGPGATGARSGDGTRAERENAPLRGLLSAARGTAGAGAA